MNKLNYMDSRSNQALNLTLDSILLALPLQSGAFKARLASRYAEVRNNA